MPSLWASPADRRRAINADSALFLVGGYDGSGNYGDVLQLATAIETVRSLPGGPLPIAIVERSRRDHHEALMRRYPSNFGAAAFAYFHDDGEDGSKGLGELPGETVPAASLLYVYGGGHLNGWWGGRKVAHTDAVARLAGRSLPVVASGLQIEEETIAAEGVANELLARASWIGVRDANSFDYVRRQVAGASGQLDLAGDDAVPFLEGSPDADGLVLNLHVNDGRWVSEDPQTLVDSIVELVLEVAKASEGQLQLQPLIAYEDSHVSERRILSQLLNRHGSALRNAGALVREPLHLLDDAFGNGLAAFGTARLTVSCSYHVALTSLMLGIPALLLAENEYYAQKAAGLRDLFQLDSGLVGARLNPVAASTALEALTDGPAREKLVSELRARSRRIAERFERGRAALSTAIIEGLRRSAAEADLAATRSRAAAAEHELEAIRATRGWRFLNALRSIRDRMSPRRLDAQPQAEFNGGPGTQHPGLVQAATIEDVARAHSLAQEGLGRASYALDTARELYLPAKMLAFASWLELRPPAGGPLISVVLATRNRPRLLARAIPSVLEQRYKHWQLVVVDDGDDPATREVAEAIEDERLLLIEGPRRGLGAARNAGLNHAEGEIVCYLDDDNVMHPGWLQAVAQVFASREDVDVAYGVTLAEHRVPDDLGDPGWWPSFWQLPWARETLLVENVTDAGALAHRRDLDGARFDEALSTGEDWDLLLRLTAQRDALAIPALSHAYAIDGHTRMSRDARHKMGVAEIRRRHASQ